MDLAAEARVKEARSDAETELNGIASTLSRYLHFTCERIQSDPEQDFRFRLVDEPRVKTGASIIRALGKKARSENEVWTVDDIVGTRVVVVTEPDREILAKAILADTAHGLVDLTHEELLDSTGYRAVHIKGWHPTSFGKVGCEIQIRTMLQDAWAMVSRADVHKRHDLPEILARIMATQADQLAATDTVLQLVREEANRFTPKSRRVEAEEAATGKESVEVTREPQLSTAEPERHIQEAPRVRTPQELASEDFIIAASVSEERRRAFLDEYLRDRRQANAVETQFERRGTLVRSANTSTAQAVGFNALMLKGPFVEGSSWAPYRTWQFALAMERHIMGTFEGVLQRATASQVVRTVERSWRSIFDEADRLSRSAQWRGHHRNLIVLTGPLDVDLMVDLHRHATPDWELPPELNKTWIEGVYADSPIMHIVESSEPAMYVVDVAALGFFSMYGEPEFELEEIDEPRATSLLHKNPDIIKVPDGLPNTREERIHQLQLHVGVRLYERYSISVRDERAVLKAAIAA